MCSSDLSGDSFGVALMTTFVARRSQYHQSRIGEHITRYDLHTWQMLQQMKQWFISRGADAFTAERRALAALYGMVQRHAAMMSFVEAFWIMCVMFWLVTPAVMLLNNPRHHYAPPQKKGAIPKPRPELEEVEDPELIHA